MKPKMYQIIYSVVLGLILPSAVFGYVDRICALKADSAQTASTTSTGSEPSAIVEEDDVRVPVLWEGGIIQEMELEEYLTGVLLAEMPGNFHPEAKKAQAVAARTVTLRLMQRGGKHDEVIPEGIPKHSFDRQKQRNEDQRRNQMIHIDFFTAHHDVYQKHHQ